MKKLLTVSLIIFSLLLPYQAFAAIAFDAATNGGITNPGTSHTFAHTVTGSDTLLLVGTEGTTGGSDLITGVTYNSVALTKYNTAKQSRWMGLWYLVGPATGTHNVVISASGSDVIIGKAVSYTGVSQTGFPDSSSTATVASDTTLANSVTTVADNSWVSMWAGDSGNEPTSTNSTQRLTGGTAPEVTFFDSNAPKTPAGSVTQTITWTPAAAGVSLMLSFAPSGVAPAITAPEMQVVWWDGTD